MPSDVIADRGAIEIELVKQSGLCDCRNAASAGKIPETTLVLGNAGTTCGETCPRFRAGSMASYPSAHEYVIPLGQQMRSLLGHGCGNGLYCLEKYAPEFRGGRPF